MAYNTMINPVTGRSYEEELATSTGTRPGAWNPTSFLPQKQNNLPQENINTMTGMVKSGSDFTPYQTRLNELLTDPSKVTQTGGYQFALDQGNQTINRSAAAKGMLGSGNLLAELAKYGQGMASQQYDTEANRLSDLISNSQRFGLNSQYFQPQQPAEGQWVGGAYMQRNPMQPSYF